MTYVSKEHIIMYADNIKLALICLFPCTILVHLLAEVLPFLPPAVYDALYVLD